MASAETFYFLLLHFSIFNSIFLPCYCYVTTQTHVLNAKTTRFENLHREIKHSEAALTVRWACVILDALTTDTTTTRSLLSVVTTVWDYGPDILLPAPSLGRGGATWLARPLADSAGPALHGCPNVSLVLGLG